MGAQGLFRIGQCQFNPSPFVTAHGIREQDLPATMFGKGFLK